MYQLLIDLDRPMNSIPSLHAGLTAYSILFAYEALRGALTQRSRQLFLAVALGWAGSILYATIATKQHWLVDLPPGILIAWLAHR